MMKLKMLLAGLAIAITTSGAAQAAVFYADRVIEATRGTCAANANRCKADDRLNIGNALGSEDGAFYSLGLGGSITLGFEQALFTEIQKISVAEITFGSGARTDHLEAVDVFSVLGGVASYLGTITNFGGGGFVNSFLPFEYIKLVDVSLNFFGDRTRTFDGFDVDSVRIAPIPLPATGILLIAGLGGMVVLRRRKQIAA